MTLRPITLPPPPRRVLSVHLTPSLSSPHPHQPRTDDSEKAYNVHVPDFIAQVQVLDSISPRAQLQK